MPVKRLGFLLLMATSLGFLWSCSSVDGSGHVLYRRTMGSFPADGPTETTVLGFGYQNREWDPKDAIPAGKGRVALLRPSSPDDAGIRLVFQVNGKGDFLLGRGGALAWNHPAGTCKIRFRSYLAFGGGERRFPDDLEPVWLTVAEGKTHWVLVTLGRPLFPIVSVIDAPDAEKVLAARGLKKHALPTDVEDSIPWLP
jgi:hypothetical protein